MRRRDLLGGVVAAAAAPGVLGVFRLDDFSRSADPSLQSDSGLLIIDDRFESARRFAEGFRGSAWTMRSFRGDITPLWHEVLGAEWPWRTGMQWRGMTTPAAALCLEQLAADRFWRLTERESHGPLAAWTLKPLRSARA